MDKQVEQPERVLDLAGYVPEFLREVREFQQLYGAQEREMKRLYGKMNELWKDSLIPSATIQGIKRFEAMLGLKPYPGDTLEERRASVSLKWNQQLPYTLPRLRERLEVVVGQEWYELWVRGSVYELELWVVDQPYRVLQDLREMTRQMIPANLLFIFAGRYPVEIPVEVAAGSRLELASDFYARYNREFLYLDGSWPLDGIYLLGGYKEIEGLDLYPVQLRMQGELAVGEKTIIPNLWIASAAAARTKAFTDISFQACVGSGADVAAQQLIRGDTQIYTAVRVQEGYQSSTTVSGAACTMVCFLSVVPISVVAAREDAATEAAMCENAWTAAGNGSRLRMIQQTEAAPELGSGLTVEKDIWYLDGSFMLDSTKLLDAQIFKYYL